MLVLVEGSAGYAVFKVLKKKKLKDVDNLFKEFQTVQSANKVVELVDFHKFKDSAEALQAALSVNDGKMDKKLKNLIKKVIKNDADRDLVILDSKLGGSIKEKFSDLNIVCNSPVQELIRCIKGQAENLIPGLTEKESTAMSLGLGHNLARYKLKFSPDKVDTMVVQAIALLDELDKQLNNYMMRCKEWYGWHFPELAKILTDNTMYLALIVKMGYRTDAHKTDMSELMNADLEQKVKETAEVSMGCEISDDDLYSMRELCKQVKELSDYREMLSKYVETRMKALAPNVSILVGETIGARLIAHAGSLINLSKMPASTIQLIGAEKALFRALKTKKKTPKYGLIFHSSLVKECSSTLKGKMSRMLAGKAALASRVDALGEADTDFTTFTIDQKAKLTRAKSFFEKYGNIPRGNRSSNFQPRLPLERRGPGQNFTGSGDAVAFTGIKRPRSGDDHRPPKSKKSKVETTETTVVREEPVEKATSEKKKKKKKKKAKAE